MLSQPFMPPVKERILSIEPYEGEDRYSPEEGFKIVTTKQEIILAISSYQSCCESWGFFLTEDDTSRFIGEYFMGVCVTDTNRSNKTLKELVYEGDVMFVDILTTRGVLQFVAYNDHNGYYGHTARVSSNEYSFTTTL